MPNEIVTQDSPELQTIKELADEIRTMDGLIYTLSQSYGFSGGREALQKLLDNHTNPRMRKEHDRITKIMQKELLSVYAPRLEPKK